MIVSLLVSGIAMMQRWFYAPALYLISVASILTLTLFAIIYFGTNVQPIPIDIVGVSLTTVLIVVFGIVYTAQYLELSAKVPLPFRRWIG